MIYEMKPWCESTENVFNLNSFEDYDGGYMFMQFTGIKDKKEIEYYIGDIGQFENGDKFKLEMEEWLEVFVVWIGDPECEDQARDLYRIENAEIIGNIYENKDLLNGTSRKQS